MSESTTRSTLDSSAGAAPTVSVNESATERTDQPVIDLTASGQLDAIVSRAQSLGLALSQALATAPSPLASAIRDTQYQLDDLILTATATALHPSYLRSEHTAGITPLRVVV